ncbi:MAG: UTP--glucose-1-phosphate uridylyltransferase GalU [bacterium]|nr:UTP--glucose-1-phosphate uridylyltransferase GalU [bacterium]
MHIRKVIIPVAGLGTRFLPATKAQPKEMLTIVDKPVIQYLVEEAVDSGIKEIIFVTGKGKRAIEDHFDNAGELESYLEERGKKELAKKIRAISSLAYCVFIRQKEPKGAGDALLQARHLVGNEPVAVLFGDDVVYSKTTPALKQLIDVFEKYKKPVLALERVPWNVVSRYGVVDGKRVAPRTWLINKIVEKPNVDKAPSNLTIVGKYILTPEVFDELARVRPQKDSELYLTDGLERFIKKGGQVYGHEFTGTRYDCGDKLGLLKAIVDFGLRHKEVKGGLRAYINKIVRGRGR